MSDLSKLTHRIFDDLLDVGTKKSMGYLPLFTIEQYGRGALTDLIHWVNAHNYDCRCYDENFCSILSGALYVWDEIHMRTSVRKAHLDIK